MGSQYKDHSDLELLLFISEDDKTAFAEIYSRYKGPLYIHAFRMLRSHDEAQDVLQDIFVTLWSKRTSILLETDLARYLFSMVRHRILNIIGHKKIEKRYIDSLTAFQEQGEALTDNQVCERELYELIEREVALLPPGMREIFEMSRKKGFSYKKIAETLIISDKTVKKQVNNALKRIRSKLDIIYLITLLIFHHFRN